MNKIFILRRRRARFSNHAYYSSFETIAGKLDSRYLTKSHFCSAIKLFSLCDIAIIDLIYTWKRWTILTTTGCNSFSSPAKLLSIGLRAGRSVCVIESNCSSDVGSWIEMNHIHHTVGKQLFDVGLFRKHWWQLVIIVIICLCFYTIPLLH